MGIQNDIDACANIELEGVQGRGVWGKLGLISQGVDREKHNRSNRFCYELVCNKVGVHWRNISEQMQITVLLCEGY